MMRPLHEKLILEPQYSFIIQKDIYRYYPTPWHYHPEFELVLVLKSSGIRTIGDNIERFTDGDLIFIGPNLPHCYKNDSAYYQGDQTLTAEAIVIHFNEDFLGKTFFNLPEMIKMNQLFYKAKLGLKILGETRTEISQIMQQILVCEGAKRVILFLSILDILSLSEELYPLANPGFVQQYTVFDNDCITRVIGYIMTNFKNNISLNNVAEAANMSIPSFCRFFKACTRKNFSSYLNETRIGYACKLLIENKYTISQICYESGFNNMSNFNRQFKKIINKSPLQYKQEALSVNTRSKTRCFA